MGKTLADGYLEIRPDLKKLGPDLRSGIRAINFNQHGRDAGKQLGDGVAKGFREGFGDGGSAFGRVVASMAARATIATGAIAALTPVVAKFTAAVAPSAGVVVALPAALAAASAASNTFKVAVSGVSDAISKGLYGTAAQYNKALEDLPPAAQEVTKAVVGLKGQIQSLRQSVAQRFFAPLTDDLKPLTGTYVPLLSKQMGDLGGRLGQFGSQVAETARTSVVLTAVRDVFQQTGQNVDILRGAVNPLGTALASLVSQTMPLLLGMSQTTVTLTQRFAAWVEEASHTGRLITIWTTAVSTIRNLAGIFVNLGSIVRDVFGYSNTSAGDLLSRLLQLTTQAARWVDSAQGARVISDIFDHLATQGDTMRNTFAGVFPQLAEALRIAAPVAEQLAQAVSRILISIAPLLPALTGVTVQLLTALIPAMNSLAGWLERNQDLVQGIAPYLVGFAVASTAVSTAVNLAALATRAWSIALGVAKAAQVAWTAVAWLSIAPVHARNAADAIAISTLGTWIGVKALELGAWVRSTAATVASTTAAVANRVATAVNTGVLTAFVAVQSGAVTAWIASTAAAVGNRIAMLASAAASAVMRGATIAWTAAQWLLNAALTANPIGIVVVAIGALVAALIYAYNHSETFRRIVDVTWAAVKVAIKATVDWFVNTAWPWLKNAWTNISLGFGAMKDQVVGAWNAVKNGITTAWNWLRDNVFNPIKNFITQTIPDAFRTGVSAITSAWDKVKEAARKPVAFVVNEVINRVIRGFNKVAGVFGIKGPDEIGGFAEGGRVPGYAAGGRIPGAPSAVDNRLAIGPGGPIKVASGEFIVNAKDTSKALPLLRWVNAGMRGGARTVARYLGKPLADTPGDGSEGWAFARGGRIPGYASGGLVGFLSDVWGAISNPSKLIAAPIEAAMRGIPGAGLIKDFVLGMGKKLIGGLTGFLTGQTGGNATGSAGAAMSFLRAQDGKPYVWASAGPGGYDCSGIVSAVWNILHGKGPYSHTFTTESLPGRFFPQPGLGGVLTAGWSHPGQSPAGPGTGHMAGQLLGMPFESRGSRGVIVGGGARRVNEFAHIGHFARGGLIPLMDRGGRWPSGTVRANMSGHDETVLTGGPDGDMADLRDLLAAILVALRGMGGDVADALTSNTRRAVQLGRGRPTTTIGQAV